MTGDLLASFCERAQGGGLRYLELWRFPDGTMNVVANKLQANRELEYSFPCLPDQLVNVVEGRRVFHSEVEGSSILLHRVEETIQADIVTPEGESWSQTVSLDTFEAALLNLSH